MGVEEIIQGLGGEKGKGLGRILKNTKLGRIRERGEGSRRLRKRGHEVGGEPEGWCV